MADGLTDAAKAEIAEAIRIVREDRFEKYIRERSPEKVKEEEKKEDEIIVPDKEKETVVPPPPKEKVEEEKTKEDESKRHSRYWGEILD